MLNQGKARYKQTKVEKNVNMIVIYLIVIQTILCLMMALFSGAFTAKNAKDTDDVSQTGLLSYIFFSGGQEDEQKITYKPITEGIKAYGQYFILLNTLVPISLIVTLEFVKLYQTMAIGQDAEMFDPESDKLC